MTQWRAPRAPTRTASQVLAQRVQAFREAHGWSAGDFAARCTAAGVPLERNVLADLESGLPAEITVQQLLTMAHVLSVPPILLFLPVGDDYRVEISPGATLATDAAVRWVCGEAMMAGGPSPGIWQRAARPLHLYRQLDDAHEERWNAEEELRRAGEAGTPSEQRDALRNYSVALTNVATVLTAMVECGMPIPALKDYTAGDMLKLGLSVPPGVATVPTREHGLV